MMNSIKNGYFMHEGLIVNVKIMNYNGIKTPYYFDEYITECNKNNYPFVNYDYALHSTDSFKIQSCEDIFGKSKGINTVKKYIDDQIKLKTNNKTKYILQFRINKDLIIAECIDYLFFTKTNVFKINHCGIIKLYNQFGIIKEEYFNNNGNYEGKRTIYNFYHCNDFYKNSFVREYNYINGKKNGIQIIYDDNGKKDKETNYLNDIIHGEEIVYYSNGNVAHIKIYNNGKFVGYKN